MWEVSEEEVIIDHIRKTNRNERQEVEMMKKCGDCIYSDNLMFVEEGESSFICTAEESMSDEEKELAKEGECPYYRAETGYNTGDNRGGRRMTENNEYTEIKQHVGESFLSHIPTPEGVGLSLMLPSEHSGV